MREVHYKYNQIKREFVHSFNIYYHLALPVKIQRNDMSQTIGPEEGRETQECLKKISI